MLATLTEQTRHSASLTEPQVQEAVEALVDPSLSAEVKADFLSALATKGETPQEIAAFARLLRDKSVKPTIDVKSKFICRAKVEQNILVCFGMYVCTEVSDRLVTGKFCNLPGNHCSAVISRKGLPGVSFSLCFNCGITRII